MVLVALTTAGNTRDGIFLCQSKFEHIFFGFIMLSDKFRIRSVAESVIIMVQIFQVLDEIGLHPCLVYSAKTA